MRPTHRSRWHFHAVNHAAHDHHLRRPQWPHVPPAATLRARRDLVAVRLNLTQRIKARRAACPIHDPPPRPRQHPRRAAHDRNARGQSHHDQRRRNRAKERDRQRERPNAHRQHDQRRNPRPDHNADQDRPSEGHRSDLAQRPPRPPNPRDKRPRIHRPAARRLAKPQRMHTTCLPSIVLGAIAQHIPSFARPCGRDSPS